MFLDLIGSGVTGANFVIISLAYLIVIVLSLSLHEFGHAFAAVRSGDNTPKVTGRLSLNPMRHMDVIGLICCAFFGFGWARPVQINPSNFRNIKKGLVWTSLAGVIVNLILAFLGYGLYEATLLIQSNNYFVLFLQVFFSCLSRINLCLLVFNLLPIYPLDGFKIVEATTKYNNSYVQFMYRYGSLILVAVVFVFDGLLLRLINLIEIPIKLFWQLIF
ncbi:MAG: site-2 protease family protein [Clostridiales bacterium]|nr:site-2 protease family protein [Clostridiales bacterium]